ncbi:phytanoyl-CoA dioxygenase family protein [Patulibacter defluvii]|uniref:phytanoyl-CoA dioxygenase family protein n=1 Tax=Patulibacter defluvii TaxID=3095358 RepID=UPI002A75A1BC|nr:phytanoyl-CoA dioxygenase family protein [Patulibacter sp. DM4]
MSYSNAATEPLAKTVAEEGWAVVGTLDRPLSRRLLGAVDEVAARSPEAGAGGQLHLLSGLAQHPRLAAVVDWPPLLALAVELLSPNIYINHSHLDVHPPHPPTGAHRWHRDNGLMGRDMRLLWRDQPRVTLKVAIYLTDVESADDGALEVVPRSHLDAESRYPTEEQPDGVPILGPAGTVAVFDARLWHRRRDNLGARTRRAMFWGYSYRWMTSRDTPFADVPAWATQPPVRRQLLGDPTVDPFYWAAGELALDPRAGAFQEAA